MTWKIINDWNIHFWIITYFFITETLRKYLLTPYVTRVCDKNYKVPETEIIVETSTSVLIPIKNTHYDEKIYPNPEKFDPEIFSITNKQSKDPYNYIPFE